MGDLKGIQFEKVTKEFMLKNGHMNYLLTVLQGELPYMISYAIDKEIEPEDFLGVYVCNRILKEYKGDENVIALNIYEIEQVMNAIKMASITIENSMEEDLISVFELTVMQLYYKLKNAYIQHHHEISLFSKLDELTQKKILIKMENKEDGYKVSSTK